MSMTGREWLTREAFRKVRGMTVKQAISTGFVVKCPTCRTIHAGNRYSHPDHRKYCGTECFRNRDRTE